MALGPPQLRRWLSTNPMLEKPTLPNERGNITIGSLSLDSEPEQWAEAVCQWALSILDAYRELDELASRWKALAEASSH